MKSVGGLGYGVSDVLVMDASQRRLARAESCVVARTVARPCTGMNNTRFRFLIRCILTWVAETRVDPLKVCCGRTHNTGLCTSNSRLVRHQSA